MVALFALLLLSGVRADRSAAELTRTYGGPTSHFVMIDGVRVHYRDEGSGEPILLIHGTSSSLHTWDAWTRVMSTHRRVLRLDLPGFGLTGPAPDHIYTSRRYATLVGHFLDRMGVARADVAGNSLGGRVALEFTLAQPTRVRKLILVDAAGLSGHRPPPIFRLVRTPGLGGIVEYVTPRFMVERNVEQVYGDPSLITDALVDRYHALLLREGNRHALVERLTGPQDQELDARLREVHVPTLLLWGGRDVWIPLSFGRRFARGIVGSELHVYPNAGHVPMEESPTETVRDAEAFLARP